jgi:hypothetical protein
MKERFDATLRDLVGRRLVAVGYWHRFPSWDWDHGSWHHVDEGVQLGTDRGTALITWTATFYPYGVEVLPGHTLSADDYTRAGPSDAAHWAGRLGSPIRDVSCLWDHMTFASGSSVDVPLALRLDFDAGPVWFVAAIAQDPPRPRFFLPGDEIVVAFSPDVLRAMGFDEIP